MRCARGSQGTVDYSDLAGCDLVIEAITENLPLKLEMWRELDADRQGGSGLRDQHVFAGGNRPGGGDRRPGGSWDCTTSTRRR